MEGPIIGVAIFYLLQYYLAALGSWYLILLGGLAILLMLFAPSGVWGVIAHSLDISLFPVRRRLAVITDSIATKNESKP
jgi:branched-chain amino acid transport system permease protein